MSIRRSHFHSQTRYQSLMWPPIGIEVFSQCRLNLLSLFLVGHPQASTGIHYFWHRPLDQPRSSLVQWVVLVAR